jgi:hypothetical protein
MYRMAHNAWVLTPLRSIKNHNKRSNGASSMENQNSTSDVSTVVMRSFASVSTKSGVNEHTIWGLQQNHPELVVQDCRWEFGLTEEQCERLREILMERGVNKWLLARRQFIALKHDLKDTIRELQKTKSMDGRELRKTLLSVYARMQHICKMPRWVEWGKHVHKDMKKNESLVVMRGRHC